MLLLVSVFQVAEAQMKLKAEGYFLGETSVRGNGEEWGAHLGVWESCQITIDAE